MGVRLVDDLLPLRLRVVAAQVGTVVSAGLGRGGVSRRVGGEMMRYAYPVIFFAFLTLLLPHGILEGVAVIGAVTTGVWGLWKIAK
jgi:arginine exporter protein ArgO